MKVVSSRFGSVVGALTVVAGLMAAACTAAPTGQIAGGDQDQTAGKDNKLPTGASQTTSPTNPSGSSSSGSATPTDPTPTPTPTDPDASTPPPPPADPGQCAATTGAEACFDCCDQANPNGMQIEFEAWDTCACQNPGVCAQACGNNYCAGGNPSAACENCLNNNTAQCDQISEQACNANPACAAAFACVEAAQCFDKP